MPFKPGRTAEDLPKAIARNIVTEAIAIDTPLSQLQIDDSLAMDGLNLDAHAKERIHKRIVRDIESIGCRTRFSVSQFSDAATVGDLITIVITETNSGGPR